MKNYEALIKDVISCNQHIAAGKYDQKDLKRIQDINKKSGYDPKDKSSYSYGLKDALNLAHRMANSMKDKNKALRRYEASVFVNGKDNEITKIFESRVAQLHGGESTKGKVYYWSDSTGAYSGHSHSLPNPSVANTKEVYMRSYATQDTGWGPSYVNTSAVVVTYYITTIIKDNLSDRDLKKIENQMEKIYPSKREFDAAKAKTKKIADEWNKKMKKKYGSNI